MGVRMREEDIAALAIVCVFGLPVAAWVFVRMMQHAERMAMIRQGIAPPAHDQWQHYHPTSPPSPGDPLQYAARWHHNPQSQLRRGVALTCIGAALLIGLSFIGYDGDGSFRLGPWLLGGLIPMFVGIAQVINAIISGATLPASRTIGTPPYPPQPPNAPPPSGPYTYRPGTAEELPRTKPPQVP